MLKVRALSRSGGGSGSATPFSYVVTKAIVGPTVRLTRPNNATPYVAGSVYGAAADARFSMVVPALPARARAIFSSVNVMAVQSNGIGAGNASFVVVPFAAQPATVLGDGALLALSDADIALVPPGGVQPNGSANYAFNSATTSQIVNAGAGILGRRGLTSIIALASPMLAPGVTNWFYMWLTAAYTPVALETMDLTPVYTVQYTVPV